MLQNAVLWNDPSISQEVLAYLEMSPKANSHRKMKEPAKVHTINYWCLFLEKVKVVRNVRANWDLLAIQHSQFSQMKDLGNVLALVLLLLEKRLSKNLFLEEWSQSASKIRTVLHNFHYFLQLMSVHLAWIYTLFGSPKNVSNFTRPKDFYSM